MTMYWERLRKMTRENVMGESFRLLKIKKKEIHVAEGWKNTRPRGLILSCHLFYTLINQLSYTRFKPIYGDNL